MMNNNNNNNDNDNKYNDNDNDNKYNVNNGNDNTNYINNKLHINIRLITKNDYSIIKLLEQFKNNKLNISKDLFEFYVEKGCKYPMDIGTSQLIFVMEDMRTMNLIGHASIIIEHKLLQELRQVAHIEDVIIDSSYRGQQLGKYLINYLVNYIKNMGCYKVILDCNDQNMKFYEKSGFKKKENQMVIYF